MLVCYNCFGVSFVTQATTTNLLHHMSLSEFQGNLQPWHHRYLPKIGMQRKLRHLGILWNAAVWWIWPNCRGSGVQKSIPSVTIVGVIGTTQPLAEGAYILEALYVGVSFRFEPSFSFLGGIWHGGQSLGTSIPISMIHVKWHRATFYREYCSLS